MVEPVLTVRGLTTRLQIGSNAYKVVDDVSFDLFPGQTLALVGESGCGKSMTALSLLRLLPHPPALPSEGKLIYQNQNILDLDEDEMRKVRGGKLSMIFQDPSSSLNPVYTIGNQLMEVANWHLHLYGDEAYEVSVKALRGVGIPSPEARMDDYPHQLSGGMRQRIMIAMALMCEPDILIADEPTTALDVTVQAQVLDLMRDLQKERGTAIILITHDWGVVAEIADEVLVMYASKIVERGSCEQIFDNPSHPYTQALFASMPTLESHKKRLKAIKGTVPQLTHYPQGCRFHPRCPHVMPVCKQEAVPEFAIEENRHQASCWLHSQQGARS